MYIDHDDWSNCWLSAIILLSIADGGAIFMRRSCAVDQADATAMIDTTTDDPVDMLLAVATQPSLLYTAEIESAITNL